MDGLLGFIPGLFSLLQSANPLRVVLESLMAAQVELVTKIALAITSGIFQVTALDYSNPAFASVWAITTAVAASAIVVLFLVGVIHGMVTASFARLPKVVGGMILAFVLPQVVFGVLPQVTHMFRSLATGILDLAAPNLQLAILRMAGFGIGADGVTIDDVAYRQVGMFAPLLLAIFLFGLVMILVVMWVLMAVEAFVFVTAPLAAIGLAGPPSTQVWFKRWLTAAFVSAFAPVPLALTIAIATALFGQSRAGSDGTVFQSMTVSVAGFVLLVGAFVSPMVGFALFKFAGDGVKSGVGFDAVSRSSKTVTHGAQNAASLKNSVQTLTNRKVRSGTPPASSNGAGGSAPGTAAPGGGGPQGGQKVPVGVGGGPGSSGAAAGAKASSSAGGASASGAAGGEAAAAAGGPVGIAAVAAAEVAKKGKEQVTKAVNHAKDQAHQALEMHDQAQSGGVGDAAAPAGGESARRVPPQAPVETDEGSAPAAPARSVNTMPPPPVRPKRTPSPSEPETKES